MHRSSLQGFYLFIHCVFIFDAFPEMRYLAQGCLQADGGQRGVQTHNLLAMQRGEKSINNRLILIFCCRGTGSENKQAVCSASMGRGHYATLTDCLLPLAHCLTPDLNTSLPVHLQYVLHYWDTNRNHIISLLLLLLLLLTLATDNDYFYHYYYYYDYYSSSE